MRRLITILLPILLSLSGSTLAADSYLSLEALTSYALLHSPDLAAASAALQSARQIAPQVASLPDPVVGINYQSDTLTPNLTGQLSWLMLSAAQEIVLPGKRSLRGQIAELAATQAADNLQAVQSELIGKTAEGYINMALAQKKLALLSEKQQLANDLIAAAIASYRSGGGSQQEVLAAQKTKYDLQLQTEQLQADSVGFEHQLRSLSGMPMTAEPLLVKLPNLAALPQQPSELSAVALQQSAALAAQKAAWDGKLLAVKLSEEERYPDYTLSGGITVAGGMPGMWNAGLQVSIPINLADRQNRAIAQATADAQLAAAEFSRQQHALTSAIYGNYAVYTSARRTMKLYQANLPAINTQLNSANRAAYVTGTNTLGTALAQLSSALDYETGYWEQYAAVLQAEARLQALCNTNLAAYSQKGHAE